MAQCLSRPESLETREEWTPAILRARHCADPVNATRNLASSRHGQSGAVSDSERAHMRVLHVLLGALHGGAGGRQAIRQCLLVLGPALPIIDHPAQQALQGPHVDTLAVRDGARIDRAGCLRNFGLYGLGRRSGVLGGWRLSIPPASQVTPVLRAIGPTASQGANREYLLRGTITRARIIPWHRGWPGKQAGGEKGVSVGATPTARKNRFHPRP